MAIARYVYAENDADWIDTAAERIEKSDKGSNCVSLTAWEASTESSIADGSYFEIAGAGYYATGDTAVTGSEATGLNVIYATGATTTASIAYSATVPVWRDDHQGWYQSAASSIRALASVYFDGGTSYSQKKVYSNNYTLTDRYGNEVVAMQVETKINTTGYTIPTAGSTVVNITGFSWTPDAILNYEVSYGTTDNIPFHKIGYGTTYDVFAAGTVLVVSNIAFTSGQVAMTLTAKSTTDVRYIEYVMVTAAKTS